MRRGVVALVLLLSPVAGQGFEQAPTDPDAAHAPVQLVLDQFPRLMELAIAEAAFDGTPHDAEQLIARMQRFFAGLDDAAPWPEQSEAARTDARASYALVDAMLDLAQRMPEEVGRLSRVDAACHSAGLVDPARLEAWWHDAFGGASGLDVLRGGLRSLAAAAPAALSVAPVRDALATLDQWLLTIAGSIDACLEEVALRSGLAVPGNTTAASQGRGDPYVRLVVVPSTVALGQQVRIAGRIVGGTSAVSLEVQGLLDETLSGDAHGRFVRNMTIPASTPLGPHVVHAQAGAASGEAVFDVVRAPVHLRLSGPAHATPGQSLRVHGSASSPLPLAPGALLELAGTTVAASGGSVSLTAPESGLLIVRLRYDGDAHHAAAETTLTIQIVVATTPTANDPVWDLLQKGVWYDPTVSAGGGGGALDRPGLAMGALLAIGAALATFLMAELALSGRRLPAAPVAAPVRPVAPTAWPRSFVKAFAALAAFLVARRALRPGATPRDVGKHIEKAGMPGTRLVRDFEALRYGRQAMPLEAARQRSHWAHRMWRRLGGR